MNIRKALTGWGAALVMALTVMSCATPKDITYFQDLEGGNVLTPDVQVIKIQPGDKISIITKSKDPQLSELFNLSVTSYRVGSVTQSGYSQQISCFNVGNDGCVDFPVLGRIQVTGLTREQVAALIKQRLTDENLVKDPVVTVEFEDLHYSIMGEVTKPGLYSISRDKVTLLDALSQASDLTIYGRRDNVMVMRQAEDGQHVYRVNLNNGQELAESPAYYLQQNDVVYVEPNDTRKRQSTVNGNNVRSTSFWLSLASLATSVAVLVFR